MLIVSRRGMLFGCTALVAAALSACGGPAAQTLISVTTTAFNYAENAVAGALEGLGLVSQSVYQEIQSDVANAENLLATIAGAVGGTITLSVGQSFLNDVGEALASLAQVLPNNPDIEAAQALVAALAALWNIVGIKAQAKPGGPSVADAMARLNRLPRPPRHA